MAANWQKILFESASIEVSKISASNVPTTSSDNSALQVLTIDDAGKVRFIEQSVLAVQNGDTTFTISGTGSNGSISDIEFQSSESVLNITTNNTDYFAVSITSGSGGTTASFDPASNFITGSPQLNALNYATSSATDGHTNGPSDYRLSFYDAFIHTGSGFTPNSFNGDIALYPDYVPLNPDGTKGIYYGSSVNKFTHTYNLAKIGAVDGPLPNGGAWIPEFPTVAHVSNRILHKVINGAPYTASRFNLWISPNATTHTNSPSASAATLDPNAETDPFISVGNTTFDRRKNYAWLSASLVGGFTVNSIPSITSSFSASFTASLETNSSSIGNLQTASQDINDTTSSMALNSLTSSLLTSIQVKSQTSNFHGGVPIAQLTILDDSDPSVSSQGRKIQLGGITPAESPLNAYSTDPNTRHLTISGTISASEFVLAGDGVVFEQINVASVAGGINYGTSSLHTHEFIGNVFVSGGGVDVNGPVSIYNDLPEEETVTLDDPIQVLVRSGSTIKVAEISGSNSIINDGIRDTANEVSESFRLRIAAIQTNIDQATPDGNNITTLQTGFGNLTASYSQGLFLGTSSDGSSDVFGSQLGLMTHTASFSASVVVGPNADHTVVAEVLVASHSISGSNDTSIHYKFNTASFISATNIITASADVISKVNDLERYGKKASNIITGSTAANIAYISGLAEDLVGGSGQHFLSGSDQSWDLVTKKPGLFNQTSSVNQGQITFSLTGSGDTSANFTDLTTTGDPQFTNLTADTVTVKGSLVKINKSNLNVRDQFILINSGALPGGALDTPNDANDPDGGIIVGNGNNSGSMFMYDKSHNRWGFIGANGSNLEAVDVESNNDNTLTPKLGVRVIAQESDNGVLFNADGTPKAISNFKYGNSTENTQLGIMAVCTDTSINPDGDVYIYA